MRSSRGGAPGPQGRARAATANSTASTAVTTVTSRARSVLIRRPRPPARGPPPQTRYVERGALAGQHGVDEQLQHRQQRAEDREHPQQGLRPRRTAAPDEDQGDAGQHHGGQRCRPARRPAPRRGCGSGARRRSPAPAIDGNATTTTNCGRNSTALVRIRPAGVQAGVVAVEDVAGDDDVGVGEHEEGQQRDRVAHGLLARSAAARGRRWSRRGSRPRRRAYQPSAAGANRPSVTPSMALVSVGLTRMQMLPSTRRGRPIAR